MESGRPRLNRRAVLLAAQAIIDERGLEACTMRAVAADLGVEAMSLYWHVPSKDALLDGVIELMLQETDLDFRGDGDWATALGEFARTFRRVVLRHRNALPLLVSRPLPADVAASRMTERGAEELEAAGFERDTAIRAARILSRYVLGFTLAERASADGPPAAPPSPPAGDPPAPWAADDPEDLFEFGLEALLKGFAAWLPVR